MAKILWIIHGYPPMQNAGAEWMAKEINYYLLDRGHEIKVECNKSPVFHSLGWDWADVIFTHLDQSQAVTESAQAAGKPCFNVIHHNWEIPHLRRLYEKTYCVYNSEWVMKDRNYPHPGIVVRPPVNPSRFESIKYNADGYITLVNCNKDKGVQIFHRISKAMPDKRFLGVFGAHGPQLELPGRNVTYWQNQYDIRTVLRETAILLVPSIYESYGRIAVEAAACGIPVIATDTPGLKESLGDAGVFVNRSDFYGWLYAIRSAMPSEKLKQRAEKLWQQSEQELNSLHQIILQACQ